MKPAQKEDHRVTFHDESLCPYFRDNRINRTEIVIAGEKESETYHEFLSGGYRRIGQVYYRNVCEGCSECLPLRLEVQQFRMSKSQKRTARMNRDISIKVLSGPSVSVENLALYQKYTASKHPENQDSETADPAEILLSIHYGYAHTVQMNYYLDSILIGVGIVDKAADGLSSNYFYYDTDYLNRRPGIFSILKEIELAKSMGKKYYYLGFCIMENPKMSYKKDFRPNQVLRDGTWKGFSV